MGRLRADLFFHDLSAFRRHHVFNDFVQLIDILMAVHGHQTALYQLQVNQIIGRFTVQGDRHGPGFSRAGR